MKDLTDQDLAKRERQINTDYQQVLDWYMKDRKIYQVETMQALKILQIMGLQAACNVLSMGCEKLEHEVEMKTKKATLMGDLMQKNM
jgi:hypothetical protein